MTHETNIDGTMRIIANMYKAMGDLNKQSDRLQRWYVIKILFSNLAFPSVAAADQ